jgi:hypothetical protein
MKLLKALCLTTLFLLSLNACGGGGGGSQEPPPPPPPSSTWDEMNWDEGRWG